MSQSSASGRFPKSARIRKRREYQRVQQDGHRLKLPHFVFVLQARTEGGASARLGITASRKVGGSVVRNRAKRLVREAFRSTPGLFPKDIDVVVIVRQAPETQRLSDVVGEWRAAERALRSRIDQARRARDAELRSSLAVPAGPSAGARC